MSAAPGRREYLDWLRGVAVLLMIGAHLLDAWTSEPDRHSLAYRNAIIVGGLGTAYFLLLAGVSVGLSAGSKARRGASAGAAAAAVAKRGLEIFALAFLFRLQAWILGWSSNPRDLLRVDILNIMGPSIVAAALVWRLAGSTRARCVALAAAAAATALLTPFIRAWPLGVLPDPIEGYFVPVRGISAFVFFPWIGFVFAGALVGVLIERTRDPAAERRLNAWLAAAGIALVAASWAGSFSPWRIGDSQFWTSSPAYFFLRTGIVTTSIAAAYAWGGMHRGGWSPVLQLGRSSLFIYWIHVEMIYGLLSRPLHRALPLGRAWVAFFLFTALMVAAAALKERWLGRRHVPRPPKDDVVGGAAAAVRKADA